MSNTLPNELDRVLQPSTYETIDGSVLTFVDKTLNIHVESNKGWVKVPVYWKGSERAFQAKQGDSLHDKNGSLKLPLITIKRVREERFSENGAIYGFIPRGADAKGGAFTITKRVQQEKTRNFEENKRKPKIRYNKKKENEDIVNQIISIPAPVYTTCFYEIKLVSEFQLQMNQMKMSFANISGRINFINLFYDSHRYEAFIQNDFTTRSSDAEKMEAREFETTIELKVLGYLIGLDKNQEKPKMTIRENPVVVRISKEREIVN